MNHDAAAAIEHQPVAGTLDTPNVSFVRDFVALLKLRMGLLAAIIAVAGYYMASAEPINVAGMIHAFVGTYLVAAGAFALNMYLERDLDSLMKRTNNRPLPTGRMAPAIALWTGIVISLSGIFYLLFLTNLLAAAAGAIALWSYVLVYTPMKRLTSLNTIVGSFPGAMPPVIGWAAAANEIGFGAILLFAILFLWQLPHFLAIAWMYKEDYAAASMPMISTLDNDGSFTTRQCLIYSVAYILVTLMPTLFGMTGWWYFWIAAITGVAFMALAVRWYQSRTRPAAVHVFLATLFHSPVIYIMMVIDKL